MDNRLTSAMARGGTWLACRVVEVLTACVNFKVQPFFLGSPPSTPGSSQLFLNSASLSLPRSLALSGLPCEAAFGLRS